MFWTRVIRYIRHIHSHLFPPSQAAKLRLWLDQIDPLIRERLIPLLQPSEEELAREAEEAAKEAEEERREAAAAAKEVVDPDVLAAEEAEEAEEVEEGEEDPDEVEEELIAVHEAPGEGAKPAAEEAAVAA